ncbi:bifunctional 2-polyprenyl-6-hydroxyphenol methylase/3-demethylubiquinol 3-O-methyltransferase UbiG [Kutzneria buriramensis]|uniref:Methyltransferase family protein n=1 Tax=Kutzneria buriramensis TaxID=1045776 RepID=A0A3E0HAQ9_9PSEU|nr:class I SAM-dependent methyltransferase [Kutzneria buriramensis]REH41127.1 methyltransferase family protein [Kutzneria buriramensis]
MTAEPLPLTGERTVPGIPEENYWFRRHEAAYLALRRHCEGATVLEAGCGEGYGADLLAGVACRVIALDYDRLTAEHVRRAYPRVGVVRGNLATLPLADASVDVVANLQVIEHLWDQHGFLVECRRVLRPGGTLLITTPNRITFSPGRDTPLNPFHTRELAPSELDSLLTGAGFRVETLQGLRHGPGIDDTIIDRQVEVVLGGNGWPDDLLTEVKAVAAEDFVITADDVDGSLDLVAVAVKP